MSFKATTFEEHCLERIRRKAKGIVRQSKFFQRWANQSPLQSGSIGASRFGMDYDDLELLPALFLPLGFVMLSWLITEGWRFHTVAVLSTLSVACLIWTTWSLLKIRHSLTRLAPNHIEALSKLATDYPQLIPLMALRIGESGVMRTSDLSFFLWAEIELKDALFFDKKLSAYPDQPSPMSEGALVRFYEEQKKKAYRRQEDRDIEEAQLNHPVNLAIKAAQEKKALEKALPAAHHEATPTRL